MRAFMVLSLAATLAACTPTYDIPAGKSQQAAYRDLAECNRDAAVTSQGVQGLMGVAMFKNAQQMCMMGRGFVPPH
jgi:hypothetical protein